MRKGTVVLVPFPFTDLSGNKVRPCVVLFSQKHGENCIIAFLSSAETKTIGLFGVMIKVNASNGLKKNSILRVDKIATLQKKIVLGELGELGVVTMKSVDAKLKKLFRLG